MASHLSILSPDPERSTDTDASASKPPPHLFRVIKALSRNTYLCRPRNIDHEPFPLPEPLTSLPPFATLPIQRMHQQAWHIEHPWSEVLIWMMQYNAASELSAKNIDLLAQVVVVKMGNIRRETEVLEALNAHESPSLHTPTLLKA
jgi:hypothetical protein